MGDEVLGALGDPGDVADAQLVRPGERRGNRQPRRIRESTDPERRALGRPRRELSLTQGLRGREVEAENIAPIVSHGVILTAVDMGVEGSIGYPIAPQEMPPGGGISSRKEEKEQRRSERLARAGAKRIWKSLPALSAAMVVALVLVVLGGGDGKDGVAPVSPE